jgi:hypothetical protein
MLRTYQSTKELQYYRLRMPKDEAYFVYFTFESNERLCFYSTLDESLKGQYREIEVKCAVELKSTLEKLINRLQQEIRLDIMEDKIITDL